MKKISIILIIIYLSIVSFSQNRKNIDQVFENIKLGFGIGFGITYPSELNDFLDRHFQNTSFTKGFPEIVLSFNGAFNAQYFVTNNIEICGELDAAWAPKVISGASPDYYGLTRVSPGFIANYHFPFKNNKYKTIFAGTGINYNFLAFKFGDRFKAKGNTPGALVQVGMMSTLRSKPIKYSLIYRYAKKKVNSYSFSELSFSGVSFSSYIYF